jgi:hypothetical protein
LLTPPPDTPFVAVTVGPFSAPLLEPPELGQAVENVDAGGILGVYVPHFEVLEHLPEGVPDALGLAVHPCLL